MASVQVQVWSVTTDGDNVPVETVVYASEGEARAAIEAGLASFGVQRCKDGQRLASASLSELSELWEEAADGVCMIEQWTLTVPEISAVAA